MTGMPRRRGIDAQVPFVGQESVLDRGRKRGEGIG